MNLAKILEIVLSLRSLLTPGSEPQRDTSLDWVESPEDRVNRIVEEAKQEFARKDAETAKSLGKRIASEAAEQWEDVAESDDTVVPAETVITGDEIRDRFKKEGADPEAPESFDHKKAQQWAVEQAKRILEAGGQLAFRIGGQERKIERVENDQIYDSEGQVQGVSSVSHGNQDDAIVIRQPVSPKPQPTTASPINSDAAKQWEESGASEPPEPTETFIHWKDFREKFTEPGKTRPEYNTDTAQQWAVNEAKRVLAEGGQFAFRIEGKERQITRVQGNDLYDAKGRAWGTMPIAMGKDDDGVVIRERAKPKPQPTKLPPIDSQAARQWKDSQSASVSHEPTYQFDKLPKLENNKVRFYRGEGTQATTDNDAAIDRIKKQGKSRQLEYVDIDRNSPHVKKGSEPGSFANFDVPDELQSQFKPVPMETPPVESDNAAIVQSQRKETQPGEDTDPKRSTWADGAQSILDAVGVADPTPITDGVNALWSLGRAVVDPKRRAEHLSNAAISGVSMIPYLGDTAKLLKTKRYAKTVTDLAGDGAAMATKANQRTQARNVAGGIVGGGGNGGQSDSQPGGSGSGGGGNNPPSSPPGSEGNGERGQSGFGKLFADASIPVLKFAASVAAAVKGVELFNMGIVALNRDLAPYHGNLAAAYAQYDVAQIDRRKDQGESQDQPMMLLLREQVELQKTIDKFANPIQALGTAIQGRVTQLVNTALKITDFLDPMLDYVQKIADWISGQQPGQGTAIQQFFQDVANGKFDNNEPPRFGGR